MFLVVASSEGPSNCSRPRRLNTSSQDPAEYVAVAKKTAEPTTDSWDSNLMPQSQLLPSSGGRKARDLLRFALASQLGRDSNNDCRSLSYPALRQEI